mgnify:CR=1 FL=1
MVNSQNNAGQSFFDIRGIQRAGTVDSGIRDMIVGQMRRAIRLIAPADIVNMGLGLSSTPGIDMSDNTGEVLVEMQEQNDALQQQNVALTNRIANLTAQNQRQGDNP